MPNTTLINPGAVATLTALSGQTIEGYVNGDSVALKVGSLVAITTQFTGSGAIKVKRAPAAGTFALVGIVLPGKGPTGTTPKGTICTVCVQGVCQARFKHATLTFKHSVIVSTATAGICKTAATPVLGKTVGVVLQTVTAATPTGLAWIRVQRA